jgi:transcriptional regulator with XRE-family HTH domain
MYRRPGELVRDARRSRGLTQKQLAIRAGTTQSAVSRIERDKISPSVETLRSLLRLLGEDLVLGIEPRDAGIDTSLIRERLKLSPAERIEYGRAFADFVIESSPVSRRRATAL